MLLWTNLRRQSSAYTDFACFQWWHCIDQVGVAEIAHQRPRLPFHISPWIAWHMPNCFWYQLHLLTQPGSFDLHGWLAMRWHTCPQTVTCHVSYWARYRVATLIKTTIRLLYCCLSYVVLQKACKDMNQHLRWTSLTTYQNQSVVTYLMMS